MQLTLPARPQRPAAPVGPGPAAWLARYTAVRGLDGLATATMQVAVPLAVLRLTGSATWTGAAFALEWVPRLLSFSVAGALADRFGAGTVMATLALIRATACTALLLLFHLTGPSLTALIGFGVLSGVLGEAGFVAAEALGADAAERGRLSQERAQAWLSSVDQTGLLAGPLLGSLLIALGTTPLFAVVLAIGAATLLANRMLPSPPQVPSDSSIQALREGARAVRRSRPLLWLIACLCMPNLMFGLLQAASPAMITQRLHAGTAQVGLAWSVAAVAGLLATAGAARAIGRFGLRPVGALACGLCPAAVLLAAVAPSYWLYAGALILFAAAEGAAIVWLRTVRRPLLPENAYASALALTAVAGLAPIPLAGIAVAASGTAHLPQLLCASAALGALVVAVSWRGLRRSTTAPDA